MKCSELIVHTFFLSYKNVIIIWSKNNKPIISCNVYALLITRPTAQQSFAMKSANTEIL